MLKAVAGGTGGGAASGITVGTSVITGGTDKRFLYDNNGVVGETAQWTYTSASGLVVGNFNAAAAPAIASGVGLQIVGTDSTVARAEVDTFAAAGFFTIRRANGTGASPTAIANADQIGAFNFHGYYTSGGPAYSGVQATVTAMATQAWTSTAQGTQILLRTTPNNSTTLTTVLTIDQNQSIAMVEAGVFLSGNGGASPASGVPGISFLGAPTVGFRRSSTTGVVGIAGGADVFAFYGVTLSLRSDGIMGFSSTTAPNTGTNDTMWSRISAGLLGVGTGAQGSFAGSVKLTDIFTNNAAALVRTNTTLTNVAGVALGTLTNAPTAGDPTKWISIDDNGTTRKIPTWT